MPVDLQIMVKHRLRYIFSEALQGVMHCLGNFEERLVPFDYLPTRIDSQLLPYRNDLLEQFRYPSASAGRVDMHEAPAALAFRKPAYLIDSLCAYDRYIFTQSAHDLSLRTGCKVL